MSVSGQLGASLLDWSFKMRYTHWTIIQTLMQFVNRLCFSFMILSFAQAANAQDDYVNKGEVNVNAYGFEEIVEANLDVKAQEAVQLDINAPKKASFDGINSPQLYKIRANKAGDYVFSMVADLDVEGVDARQIDVTVKVYHQDGTFIKSLSLPQLPFFNNVFDNLALDKGEYYVSAQTSGYSGAYIISVQFPDYGEDIISADIQTTAIITPGKAIVSALQGEEDKDWYRFETDGGLFGFVLKRIEGTVTITNPIARIYDNEGRQIRENLAYDGKTLNAQVVADLAPGTYFVEVASMFDFGFGRYTLEAVERDADAAKDDIGANIATAYLLNSSAPVTSKLDYSLDQDWFKVSVGPEDVYSDTGQIYLNLKLVPEEGVSPQFFNIIVYDAAGARTETEYLASAKGVDLALSEGEYYLSVESGPDNLAKYSISAAPFDITKRSPLDVITSRDEAEVDPTGGDKVMTYYAYKQGETATGPSNGTQYEAEGWNVYQRKQIRAALTAIEAYIDVKFQEVEQPANAELRFITNSSFNSAGGAFTYDPSNEEARGLILLAPGEINGIVSEPSKGMDRGGLGYYTVVHEVVHVLGLAHPFDDFGGSDILPGVIDQLDLGAFEFNQSAYTILAYGFAQKTRKNPSQTRGYASTPMPFDLGVLQAKYGVNHKTGRGDNLYHLTDENALGTDYSAIWDVGGNDTIIYSGSKSAQIDLRPASLKYEIGGGGYMSQAEGIVGGYIIASGVVIEKAQGGAGDDVLIGNAHANRLEGNQGSDRLTGGAGADVFIFNGVSNGDDVVTDFHQKDHIELWDSEFSKSADVLSSLNETDSGTILRLGQQGSVFFVGCKIDDFAARHFIIK